MFSLIFSMFSHLVLLSVRSLQLIFQFCISFLRGIPLPPTDSVSWMLYIMPSKKRGKWNYNYLTFFFLYCLFSLILGTCLPIRGIQASWHVVSIKEKLIENSVFMSGVY